MKTMVETWIHIQDTQEMVDDIVDEDFDRIEI